MPIILTEKEFLNSYNRRQYGERFLRNNSSLFPIKSSPYLAAIASYLTFDGHLTVSKSMFLFGSKNISELRNFDHYVKSIFNIEGRIESVNQSHGESYAIRYFSKPLCRVLNLIGVPSGKKVNLEFHIPEWIKNNKECSRAYLRAAFDCEGCFWKEGKCIRIRFRIYKNPKFKENCISFLNQLKEILHDFDIETTQVWTGSVEGNSMPFTFQIRSNSTNKFYKEIGSSISRKLRVLQG